MSFVPELWSKQILQTMQEQNAFFRDSHLDPRDTWVGEGAHTYEEAVAWARLLNVHVMRPDKHNIAGSQNFRLLRQGCPPLVFPICSPEDLIRIIRAHASPGLSNMPVDPPRLVGTETRFRHVEEPPRADKIGIVRRGMG